MKSSKELKAQWSKAASAVLVGKTIKSVRYLTDQEMDHNDWTDAPLVIIFTDGSYIYPSSDDEGNNGGALFTSFEQIETIPVIRQD